MPRDDVTIRPMREDDLAEADRIFRLAFGTFLGFRDPLSFAGDSEWVRHRFRTAPEGALVAERDGVLVGSNLAVRRGSVAFFGPLSVRPDLWEGGIAKRLVAATVDVFARWGVRHAGLFTFAHSAKHVALYQKFGFWPGSLMAVLERTAQPGASAPLETLGRLDEPARREAVAVCRRVADRVYAGLDPSGEIDAVLRLGLGDVVLVREHGDVVGFAVCHCGAGTEAGSGVCFAKLVVLAPGAPLTALDDLLDGCARLALERGLERVAVGVSLACRSAYRRLLERGFRTELQGVAMYRPDEPGYHTRDTLVLDDWR